MELSMYALHNVWRVMNSIESLGDANVSPAFGAVIPLQWEDRQPLGVVRHRGEDQGWTWTPPIGDFERALNRLASDVGSPGLDLNKLVPTNVSASYDGGIIPAGYMRGRRVTIECELTS